MHKTKQKKPSAQQIEQAKNFAKTPRGQLIFGQALALGCEALKDSEPSNSDDMKYLGENLFGIWYMIYSPEGRQAIEKATEDANKLNAQANS